MIKSKPTGPLPALRLVVGFSRGSASHNIAALLTPGLEARLGRRIELIFVSGESGAVAARTVAAAPPDGNTLFIATLGTHALLPAARRDCGYDPLADFTPISLLLAAPLVLAVPASTHIRGVSQFVQIARAAVPPLRCGNSAVGGAPHLAAEIFSMRAGIPFRHVRYDDTRQLYADLIDGRLDLSLNNLMSMLPLLRQKRLIALGTTGLHPHPLLPAVLPLDLGDPIANWVGLVGPPGLPQSTVQELALAAAGAARDAAAIPENCDLVGSTPQTFGAHLRSEWQRWLPVVRVLDLDRGLNLQRVGHGRADA